MKKQLLLGLAFGVAIGANAQSSSNAPKSITNIQQKASTVAITGKEVLPQAANAKSGNQQTPKIQANEATIGETTYDLQTNSATARRLVNLGGGNLSATWTFSSDPGTAWPDRGTGYNYYNGSNWGSIPTSRIESVRTGWPEAVSAASGKELVICHDPGGSTLYNMSRGSTGPATWSSFNEGALSDISPPVALWPRTAVSGNIVHNIGITTPVANGGSLYNGTDGALLYSRSQDGGATWDIVSIQLPGSDTSNFSSFSGDSYSIDAKGSTVAIVSSALGHGIPLWKSTDNGTTWTMSWAMAPQIPKFDESVHNTDIILNGDSMYTADGSSSVIIDNNGLVHVFFGRQFIVNDDITDGLLSFFPGMNGIDYWNESFGDFPPYTITGAFANITGNINSYRFSGQSTFPSAGVDANNCLYLTFSALYDDVDANNNHLRHIFATKSCDNGCSWTYPKDLTTGHPFEECVFNSTARDVDNNIHTVYQQDFDANSYLNDDTHPIPVTNNIIYNACPVGDLDTTVYFCVTGIRGDSVFCAGDTVQLEAICGTSWLWNTGATTQIIDATNNSTTYTVTITSANCGSIVESINTSAFTGNPVYNTTASQNEACPGDNTTLMTSNVTGGAWVWEDDNSVNVGNSQSIVVSDTGWYYVTVTNCGGTTEDSVYIAFPPAPTASISGPTTICPSGSIVLSANTVTGATYAWSSGGTDQAETVNATGTYTVTITNCAGTTTASVNIFPEPPPTTTITPDSDTTICEEDGPLVLVASGAATYSWSNGATTSSISLTLPSESGAYDVTGYNICGDSVTSATINVTINPTPAVPSVTYDGQTFTCTATGVTYQWYVDGQLQNGETNSTYAPNSFFIFGKDVTCVITDSNGCSNESAITVGVENSIDPSTAVKVYPNPNNGQFGLYFNSAAQDIYNVNIANIIGQTVLNNELEISGSYTMNIDLSGFEKGVYLLTVTNSNSEFTQKIVVK